MRKVLICIPLSWHMVHREFFFSYQDMVKHAYDNGFSVEFVTCSKIYLHLNRELLGDATTKIDADYILWLDVDQIYATDTIPVLANHVDNGKLIVTGMTADKMTGMSLNYKFNPNEKLFSGVQKMPLVPNQGLVETECTGFGGVMMHPKVMNKLIQKPRFSFTNKETIYKDYGNLGEDFAFFWKCKKAKVRIWCDTNLKFGHLKTETVYSSDR